MMAKHTHHYTCKKCGKKTTMETESAANPMRDRVGLHMSLSEAGASAYFHGAKIGPTKYLDPACPGVLLYQPDEIQLDAGPLPPAPAPMEQLAGQYWATTQASRKAREKEMPGMICAARMTEAPYVVRYGWSAHRIARAELAGGLGNAIPDPGADVVEWGATNCSEVEAAHKILLATGLEFGKSGGIDFYCIDANGVYRPPCVNCAVWINRI